MCIEQITVITNKDDQNVIEIYKIYVRKWVRCLNQYNSKLVEYLVRYCFVLFLFLSRLWFFSVCLLFFFIACLFHQRRMATFDSNTTESFCVPWSWTNNLSYRHKRHRKYGECCIDLFVVYLLFRGLKDSLEINMKKPQKLFFSLAGSLRPSSSFLAVFPDGSFLLDAGGRNLFLPVCRESL